MIESLRTKCKCYRWFKNWMSFTDLGTAQQLFLQLQYQTDFIYSKWNNAFTFKIRCKCKNGRTGNWYKFQFRICFFLQQMVLYNWSNKFYFYALMQGHLIFLDKLHLMHLFFQHINFQWWVYVGTSVI